MSEVTYAYKSSGWRFTVNPGHSRHIEIQRNLDRAKQLQHEPQPPKSLFLSQVRLAYAIESIATAEDLEDVKQELVLALREIASYSHGIEFVQFPSQPKI